MSTSATLSTRVGDLVAHEVSPTWGREKATLLGGSGAIVVATVLGRILVGAASAAAKTGGNTGNGAFTLDATTPVLAGARPGVYTVRCITAAANGGVFRVEDPDGLVMGDVAVGSTFADDLKFTIADGAADFIVGDGWDITVAEGSGKVVPLSLTARDGSQIADSIALEAKASSASDQDLEILARGAVVNSSQLVWPAGATDAQKASALSTLKRLGIVARASI
ncbi:MAG TPA: head decoration protein [Fibrobacteria bacterium]|nr:head decoration protein [Fibrobacteria bacterium]